MRPFFSRSGLTLLRRKLKRPVALFLDYDGTLVPIAPRPELAWLSDSTRFLLRSLSKWVPVVFVSGRSLMDLRSRIRLRGMTYVGNHGLEIKGPGFRYQMEDAFHWRRFLKKVACQLQAELDSISGIFLEDKGYTLSVHYRQADTVSERNASRVLYRGLKPIMDLIQIRSGKSVWEILPPVEWDKGRAVTWILKRPEFQRRWPLYIGDDETDQDAFRSIRSKGIGIAVGSHKKKNAAHFYFSDQLEVDKFLKWLLAQLSTKEHGQRNS